MEKIRVWEKSVVQLHSDTKLALLSRITDVTQTIEQTALAHHIRLHCVQHSRHCNSPSYFSRLSDLCFLCFFDPIPFSSVPHKLFDWNNSLCFLQKYFTPNIIENAAFTKKFEVRELFEIKNGVWRIMF